jgi:hypothetical protein
MAKGREKYYKFSNYLKQRFACRVYKVSIDAGFSCPNKDGRISNDGCIYCENRAFSPNVRKSSRPLEEQIKEGINFGKRRYAAEKFIVYFQAYTNTYAPLDIIKQRYDVVRKFKDVVGISIGTRPDCVNREILDLIETYAQDYEVWLEYGLQSIHKKTLELINRGHSYEDFKRAIELTKKKKKIKICVHIIIGLPNETREDILETAKEIGQLKVDGIKMHPLHVIKGTKLEELLNKGFYRPLEFTEYINLATEFLEYLWPSTVIQRIAADCPKEFLVAPLWVLEKNMALRQVEDTLLGKGRFQGRLYRE